MVGGSEGGILSKVRLLGVFILLAVFILSTAMIKNVMLSNVAVEESAGGFPRHEESGEVYILKIQI